MKFVGSFVALALATGVCSAQTAAPKAANASEGVRFFLGLDAGGGGDTLATVHYTNGHDQSIKAGGGVQIKGGIDYPIGSAAALRASVGYHYHTTAASNGDVTFSRWPLEVLGMWKLSDSFRLGAGVRYATNAKLTSSGAASNLGSLTLKGKAGVVLEGEYLYGTQVGIALRFVGDKYKVGNTSVSGNHVALGLNYYF